MLAVRPECGTDGADRVDLPVVGLVRQLDPLALPREDDGVVADHVAAAHDREADVAALARAGVAVADAGRHGVQIDPADPWTMISAKLIARLAPLLAAIFASSDRCMISPLS